MTMRLMGNGLLGIAAGLLCAASAATAAEPVVWVEGEKPARTNLPDHKPASAERAGFLSENAWTIVGFAPEELGKLPAESAVLEYVLPSPTAGNRELWARIGFEFARSPFRWRLNGGAWTDVSPDALTSDLMEVGFFSEVAWLKLGDVAVTAGDNRIEFEIAKTKDAKGEPQRLLFALDALVLSDGPFVPNGKFKPGQEWKEQVDTDAEKTGFTLPEATNPSERTSVKLSGLWQIARHDEQSPGKVDEPIAELPKTDVWKGIAVPSNKNTERPDLLFAHRLWYRTQIDVPASLAGRSFYLEFPQNNLNTTVYVNGVLSGFNKNPFAEFRIDVTKAIKPGQKNELMVGIRDAWYARSTSPTDPMKLRRTFNRPERFFTEGFQDLAYPIWNHSQSGILVTPTLVAAGSVYVDDAFPMANVAEGTIDLELTVKNPSATAASGQITLEAIDDKTGVVAHRFDTTAPVALDPGQETTMRLDGLKFPNAKLWWPDEPNLYRLRTTVSVDGKPVDIAEQLFGYRQWTNDGPTMKLNGVAWPQWGDLSGGDSPESFLATYRKNNTRSWRFWGMSWLGRGPEETLEFMDRNGVVVRRSGLLDGQRIGYNAIENDPELKTLHGSETKVELMNNWYDQMVAQVKGERNHPSISHWSLENEWLYINCINLYGGLMDEFEQQVAECWNRVRAADPTRLAMVDGGGAGKNQVLPMHGDHYVFGRYPDHPDLAYDANVTGGGRGRWTWDQKRPRWLGEDYFANGINPFDFAYFGGEEAFIGKAATARSQGIIYRMLTEGYRWAGFAGWTHWMASPWPDSYISQSPVAVFSRQWDWTFESGQTAKRTLRVFNDTRFADPIEFAWTLTIDGQPAGKGNRVFSIDPGSHEEFVLDVPMPKVAARSEGELVLALTRGGTEIFRDTKAVSILNTAAAVDTKGQGVLVFDPKGDLKPYLDAHGVKAKTLDSLDALPDEGKVLIVGRDAIDEQTSASSRFMAWAAPGRAVIVLEQEHPLRFQAVPGDLKPEQNHGATAFPEDLSHPALSGLATKDFWTWGTGENHTDHRVYKNAYGKPSKIAKSLVQVHERLGNTALVEAPAGKGILLLSQLKIGERLASNAVARQVLGNLITYAAGYEQTFRPVTAAVSPSAPLAGEIAAIGLQYEPADDVLKAITPPGPRIAVIEASPANLKTLAGNLPAVREFNDAGGWILFSGLTPEGLTDYNKIVGVEHMIRPFRRERVTFPPQRDPLTAGLTTSDIVMESGQRINNFTSDTYLASDVFSYLVDVDDVAPFATLPPPSYFGYTESTNDHDPYNMVNGFVSSDSWQYIFSINHKTAPTKFDMSFPGEVDLGEIEWTGNAFYNKVTRLELSFDGGEPVVLDTEPSNEPQTFPLPPGFRGKVLTVNLAEHDNSSPTPVVGVDNIRLRPRRADGFEKQVRPMLNIGAMVHYPRGKGGFVLSQVRFQENETVPANKAKKRAILATILRNLQAPFGGGEQVIAGADLDYAPVDLSKHATAFRGDNGWFGDPATTFKDLPLGRQTFAGVPFEVYDFKTSPVPTVVMLRGDGVPGQLPEQVTGIAVNRTADALFFLHTARIDQRMNDDDRRNNRSFEMLKYVVHYQDGSTAEVPIVSEADIDDYRRENPAPIAGAQIGWTAKYAGRNDSAVAYVKQWDNPRPTEPIASIDMVYGKDRRGVPALIAITAASSVK